MITGRMWLLGSLLLFAAGIAGGVALGFCYYDEPDYWLVGLPGLGTALGTVALAGATFRLIQREAADRDNTITALSHSQVMATEAARQRRDARARRLEIRHWGDMAVSLDPMPTSENKQSEGATFNIPGDAAKKLYISQGFVVNAEDNKPMSIVLNGLYQGKKFRNGVEEQLLSSLGVPEDDPDNAIRFVVGRTVAEWVEIAIQRENGEPGDEAHAWISVDDTYDDGVRDTYELVAAGCPLKRSPQLDGQWILDTSYQPTGFKAVVFAKQPVVRNYFLSKTGNRWLHESM